MAICWTRYRWTWSLGGCTAVSGSTGAVTRASAPALEQDARCTRGDDMILNEDMVEQAAMQWLSELGWSVAHGPDISPPDAKTTGTERPSYREVVLAIRLGEAIARLNPHIPPGARDDALRQVLSPNVPGLANANRQLHRWLVDGVPVQFQKDGETRGARVRLLDFENVSANDWLAVNQFSVQGPKLTRRPDVVLFVNGL